MLYAIYFVDIGYSVDIAAWVVYLRAMLSPINRALEASFDEDCLGGLVEADRIIADHAGNGSPSVEERAARALISTAEAAAVGLPIDGSLAQMIRSMLGHLELSVNVRFGGQGDFEAATTPINKIGVGLAFAQREASEEGWDSAAERRFAQPLLDLLVRANSSDFRLRRCLQDGRWFIPEKRSGRSRFCSTSCRNRFNYRSRDLKMTFRCVLCVGSYSISSFSGIVIEHPLPQDIARYKPILGCVDDPGSVCERCILDVVPAFAGYVGDESASDNSVARAGRLTARELQIVDLITNGLSNQQIAENLVLSQRTVEAHLSNLLAKLKINSRAQLAVWRMRTLRTEGTAS